MKPQHQINPLETLDDTPARNTVGDLQSRLTQASRVIAQLQAENKQLHKLLETIEKQTRPFDETIPG